MTQIDATARVAPGAAIGNDVTIGPLCVIGPNVVIGDGCRLVRVMPNTPCLVGASASGYAPGAAAIPEDVALVDRLLNAVGRAFRLP